MIPVAGVGGTPPGFVVESQQRLSAIAKNGLSARGGVLPNSGNVPVLASGYLVRGSVVPSVTGWARCPVLGPVARFVLG